MHRRFRFNRAAGLVALMVAGAIAVPAFSADIQARYHTSDDTLLRIGQFTFEGGKTLNLTVGIGSAAWHGPNDPPNVIWTVGDRGPNIACSEMKEIAGMDFAPCKGVQNGRIYRHRLMPRRFIGCSSSITAPSASPT